MGLLNLLFGSKHTAKEIIKDVSKVKKIWENYLATYENETPNRSRAAGYLN